MDFISLDYDARVRDLVKLLVLALTLAASSALPAQDATQKPDIPKSDAPKSEPEYEDTFSGPVVEITAEKITVMRSVLGKPAEKHTFMIKPDTRIEGNSIG